MKYIIYLLAILIGLPSCQMDKDSSTINRCTPENLSGKYLFYADNDTSEQIIEINAALDSFTTNGISGYDFWYPASPLSGTLDGCEIFITAYENVMKTGLPSPGGTPRYYYENLNGNGHFFPESDSIVLFVNYWRTGFFTENFSGNIYLKKVE